VNGIESEEKHPWRCASIHSKGNITFMLQKTKFLRSDLKKLQNYTKNLTLQT